MRDRRAVCMAAALKAARPEVTRSPRLRSPGARVARLPLGAHALELGELLFEEPVGLGVDVGDERAQLGGGGLLLEGDGVADLPVDLLGQRHLIAVRDRAARREPLLEADEGILLPP